MKKIYIISLACLFLLGFSLIQTKTANAQTTTGTSTTNTTPSTNSTGSLASLSTSDVIPSSGSIFSGDLKGIGQKFDSVPDIIKTIFQIVILAAGTVFVIMILIGGITYLTSAGNEDGTNKARKMILDALVGLIIVLAAYAIGTYILGLLGFSSSVGSGANGTTGGSATGTTTSTSGQTVAQPVSIHWTVRDQNKKLLSGVTVSIDGNTQGSTSQFSSSVSQPGGRNVTATSPTYGTCSETLNLVAANPYVTIQYNTSARSCTMTTSTSQQEFVQ